MQMHELVERLQEARAMMARWGDDVKEIKVDHCTYNLVQRDYLDVAYEINSRSFTVCRIPIVVMYGWSYNQRRVKAEFTGNKNIVLAVE